MQMIPLLTSEVLLIKSLRTKVLRRREKESNGILELSTERSSGKLSLGEKDRYISKHLLLENTWFISVAVIINHS